MSIKNWLPIRKVFAGLVASGVFYGARKLNIAGLDHAEAANIGQTVVGFVVAYLVPDPRVQKVARKGMSLVEKVRALIALVEAAGDPPAKDPVDPEAAPAAPVAVAPAVPADPPPAA